MSTILTERFLRRALIVIALGGLILGLLAWAVGRGEFANWIWAAGTAPVVIGLLVSMIRDFLAGRMGVDAIAFVSMSAALALGENLAGVVVAVMYAGGNVLEDFAIARAERDLKSLIDRAPRIAHRRQDSTIADIPIEQVAVGDVILVRAGEVIPIDGIIISPGAMIDEAALTGEPIPVTRREGEPARSGTVNAGETFEIRATATAGESTYAGIVRMVNAAQTAKAPFIRLADRYALLLFPITPRRRRRGLAAVGRSHSRTGRAGRRDPVSADPGGASCVHRRRRASGAAWHPYQGRQAVRGTRSNPYCDVRQDRNIDGRGRSSRCDRDCARREPGRRSPDGRLVGAGVASCRRGRHCGGRSRQGARSAGSIPSARDHGIRAGGDDRWPRGPGRIASTGLWGPQARGVGRARSADARLGAPP